MSLATSTISDYWRRPVIWLALVVSAITAVLGLRAFLDPAAASAGFGLPMSTPAETAFVQVYGARNAYIGSLALAFLLRQWVRPAALTFALALALPLFDMWVVASRVGVGPELIRYAVILVVLAAMAGLLWRQQRAP